MRKLVSKQTLDKYSDFFNEEVYKGKFKLLEKFRETYKNSNKLYSESGFDAEFTRDIFVDILGYDLKRVVREAFTTSGNAIKSERPDVTIFAKDETVPKIVIELKDLKTPDLFKKSGQLSAVTQCAKYLFQIATTELGIVSNFDKIIVFNKKELFRQEYSISNMSYEVFKEFYLLLSAYSFDAGLTKMLIKASGNIEKELDDEFFIKIKLLHKKLLTEVGEKNISDIFNKFLALLLLEDTGKLPKNTIDMIHGRKNDFDHLGKKTSWAVFSDFFTSLKSRKNVKEYLGISEETSALSVWTDSSYFKKSKISKSTLDLLKDLSSYDLAGKEKRELFFKIAEKTNGSNFQYTENLFEKLIELNKKLNFTGLDTATALVSLKASSLHGINILFNELSENKITIGNEKLFSITQINGFNHFELLDFSDLSDKTAVKRLKKIAKQLTVVNLLEEDFILVELSGDDVHTPLIISNNGYEYTINREKIFETIEILSMESSAWLDLYISDSINLSTICSFVKESQANIRFDLVTGTIATKLNGVWNSENDLFESEEYMFIFSNDVTCTSILGSADFWKAYSMFGKGSQAFKNMMVSSKLLSSDFRDKAIQSIEIKEDIRVLKYKFDKLEKNGAPEIEKFRLEEIIDNLTQQEKDLWI